MIGNYFKILYLISSEIIWTALLLSACGLGKLISYLLRNIDEKDNIYMIGKYVKNKVLLIVQFIYKLYINYLIKYLWHFKIVALHYLYIYLLCLQNLSIIAAKALLKKQLFQELKKSYNFCNIFSSWRTMRIKSNLDIPYFQT